jgi:SAM-dependent methyltransferase
MRAKPDLLKEEYQIRFSEAYGYRNKVWKVLCQRYFSKFVPGGAHILDLGSGWGEFINNIGAAKKYAMDLNPDAAVHLNQGIHFLHQDCSQPWQMPSESLDVVFTSNFLEHLPDKQHIEAALSEVFRCLKKDGQIICLGPNIKYIPGAYWDFWGHFVPITDLALVEVLRLQGFDVELRVDRFLPYSMSTGKTPPLFLVKLYLQLPVFWPLLGKQFLVVGRKRQSTAPGASTR